ncbi:DUF4097 family beta strand repeat-containing protein [Kitasatospora sp. NPDC001175]|uniref:DUF4097 family beta strand repeat-containing protein n=1 Tax=Kitasatospora sp. NPDC001175 TaxID=3157103 RepID=UPI003D0004B9
MSGPVWGKSTSGSISARELGSSEVDVASSSGQMDLGFALPPRAVTATTTSGPVVVTVPGGNTRYRVDGHTSSHSWNVDPDVEDSSSARKIDITSMSGPVTVSSTSVDSSPGSVPSSESVPLSAPVPSSAPAASGEPAAFREPAPGAPRPGMSAVPPASSPGQP